MAWGVSFISTKVLLESGLHPIEIYIYRFAIAYLAMLLICHKKILSNSLRHEFMFMLCGLFGGSISLRIGKRGPRIYPCQQRVAYHIALAAADCCFSSDSSTRPTASARRPSSAP